MPGGMVSLLALHAITCSPCVAIRIAAVTKNLPNTYKIHRNQAITYASAPIIPLMLSTDSKIWASYNDEIQSTLLSQQGDVSSTRCFRSMPGSKKWSGSLPMSMEFFIRCMDCLVRVAGCCHSIGLRLAVICARWGSRNGGSTRRSPSADGSSSTAKPGPCVAISKSTPFGSRTYRLRNQ